MQYSIRISTFQVRVTSVITQAGCRFAQIFVTFYLNVQALLGKQPTVARVKDR